jgi:hypothetical protein
MLEIVQFEPEHLELVMGREPDRGVLLSLPDVTRVASEYATRGPSWTGFWNGQGMACVGLVILWPHVAEGWAYTSDLVRQHPCAFHRAVCHKLRYVMQKYELNRLQLSIQRSNTVSRMWAYRLGFRSEGKMRKFGPEGEDYVRYSLVI